MEQLLMTSEYFHAIKDHHTDLIFTTDLRGHITMVNTAFIKEFGEDEMKVAGTHCHRFFSKNAKAEIQSYFQQAAAGNIEKADITEEVTRPGKSIYYRFQLIPVSIKGRCTEILFIGRNMTEQYRLEAKMKQLTYYEERTGLPNRNKIEKVLSNKIKQAQSTDERFALLFIKIERIKTVAASLGHEAEDQARIHIAKRIQSILPEGSFLGGFSTDTFAVLMKNDKKLHHLKETCQRIFQALEKPLYLEDQEYYMDVVIGTSAYPADGENSGTLLKNAGLAISRAGADAHQTLVFYSNEMNAEMKQQVNLERSLRKGLANNEFFLVYQPIIHSVTGKITSCEALLRWAHSEQGMVSPLKFIPVAEETGVIHALGQWILKTACMQVKKWQKAGFENMSVSVNVSPYQLNCSGFSESVKEALAASDLKPEYLHLELTESIMISQSKKTVKVMNELKEMGVHMSIDDFGTGYASFSYLKQLPIHELKIDRTFIQNLNPQSPDFAIVHAILTMGRSLGLQVVAEGIETKEQLTVLAELGCDFVQGYFIEKPLEASRFTQWLEKNTQMSNVEN